ncbi:MAG: asparagine synthase (glutamine-hydrolyzing), partial [Actinomycetota bacterium]|nr:asparagine synthase (glutamine-hydrolyzing) [Actinomycetota bacterium]
MLGTTDGFAVGEDVAARMRDTMTHRGPDDGGTWSRAQDRIAFGHRRLSIVDLSPAGHQPMCNEDGTVWITYNGEIYNHAALRDELERKGHTYRSNTDTETIVHLYEEEGERCVERLQGMFAFGIWDTRRRELFLARDRVGIKPLYYAQPAGGFVFGSEIKALLEHPAITPELDEEAFHHYLTFICTPAPMTMFKGVRKLAPGERMVVTADGRVRSEVWWSPFSPRVAADVGAMSEGEQEERLIELLRAAIKKRMMADVPFGVFLSGGVDSSTNVALMSELMDQPVRTFTVAFDEHEKYNELQYARQVAERYGTDHHEIVIDDADLAAFVPELIHHQDEPIADWVCVPLHFVAKLARDSGTIVVQVGEGSDELFHGYRHYLRQARLRRRLWEPLMRMPRPVRRFAAAGASQATQRLGRGFQYGDIVGAAAEERLPFWGGAVNFRGDIKRKVLTNGRVHPDAYGFVDELWQRAERELPGADLLQKMTFLELKLRLAELLLMRVDKMTMATSVEARVPFLDHDFVEFAVALPERMKVRDGVGKYALKKAVDGLVPSELVHRPKQGFGAPVSEWFRGDLGTKAQREIRGSSLTERGLLDYDYVDSLWARHRAGRGDWAVHLWTLYN